jgi:glycine cleavage system aminomethyltransferase T
MTLEFLAADATVEFDGIRPPQRSPIEWIHRRDGASFAERDGWRVVTDFGAADEEAAACATAVAIADLSHLGKLELQAKPETAAAIVAQLAGGAALAPGRAAHVDGVWWCPVTPARILAVSPPERTPALRDELEAAAGASGLATVSELTTALGSNAVAGPLAREAFARATALDLRPDRFEEGGFAPVSVARTAGMILRAGDDRFLHLFGSGYAQYVWTVFVDAAEHLGGRAVGTTALEGQADAGA